jgi:dihydrolipoamide dehydrogenase
VIGAGVIGRELGSVWARLGSKVTVLEYLDRILPGMDGETAALAKRIFERQGLAFRLGARVTAARVSGDSCTVEVEGDGPISCDRVLVCVGRVPNTEARHRRHQAHARPGGEYRSTSISNVGAGVHAIGDVIAGPCSHKGGDEGIAYVRHRDRLPVYVALTIATSTRPGIASVGRRKESQAGIAYMRLRSRQRPRTPSPRRRAG